MNGWCFYEHGWKLAKRRIGEHTVPVVCIVAHIAARLYSCIVGACIAVAFTNASRHFPPTLVALRGEEFLRGIVECSSGAWLMSSGNAAVAIDAW
jgi:hypothetical protein